MNNRHKIAGLIGPVDDLRRERLLALDALTRANANQTLHLRFPDHLTMERAALNDLALDGPRTILSLPRMLADHSQLIGAGVPVMTSDAFEDLVVPVLDRTLEATWGGTSPDIGDSGITAGLPKPKRLSAFIVVSDQLRTQNPLLVGAWIEAQLLAAIGRALDAAAIGGDGTGDNPLGLTADTDIPTRDRAVAGTDGLADLAGMEKVLADANHDPAGAVWITDTATAATLKATEGIGAPIWAAPGPLGYVGIASLHAPASTCILARRDAMAFIDWGKLKVESLIDRTQAIAGFRQLHVSGYFDFSIPDTTAIVAASDPA